MPPPTHYEILALPPSLLTTTPSSSSSSHNQLLKRAYRRALLNHHPDKTNIPTPTTSTQRPTYTIDQITLAYTTLSTPSLRAAYDRDLVLTNTNPFSSSPTKPNLSSSSSQQQDRDNQKTGLETVDLDDLSYDDESRGGEWFRACRCGNARGFRVGEEDLDEALGEVPGGGGMGEVVVGCVDCSLWLRVLFAVAEGEEEEGKGEGTGDGTGEGKRES